MNLSRLPGRWRSCARSRNVPRSVPWSVSAVIAHASARALASARSRGLVAPTARRSHRPCARSTTASCSHDLRSRASTRPVLKALARSRLSLPH